MLWCEMSSLYIWFIHFRGEWLDKRKKAKWWDSFMTSLLSHLSVSSCFSYTKYGNTCTTLWGKVSDFHFYCVLWRKQINSVNDKKCAKYFGNDWLPFRLPPGPTGLPFVGVVNKLDPLQVRQTLQQWKDQYGDIYSFTLPGQQIVVVSPRRMSSFLKNIPIYISRSISWSVQSPESIWKLRKSLKKNATVTNSSQREMCFPERDNCYCFMSHWRFHYFNLHSQWIQLVQLHKASWVFHKHTKMAKWQCLHHWGNILLLDFFLCLRSKASTI